MKSIINTIIVREIRSNKKKERERKTKITVGLLNVISKVI
jgi:hypothetical protein